MSKAISFSIMSKALGADDNLDLATEHSRTWEALNGGSFSTPSYDSDRARRQWFSRCDVHSCPVDAMLSNAVGVGAEA
ncbi:hypothetical protein MCP1_20216 [Candidatus Terasakiella magnetica]|nr:hypothetical protein MCP1_20216 [Candidatus Terasakiella magnetica]